MCDVNGAACHPSSSYLCNISFQCHACSWAPADVVQSVPGLEMPFCSWWFLWQPTPAHGGRRPWPPVDGQQECVMNLLVFYFMQHAIRLIFPHICLRHSLNLLFWRLCWLHLSKRALPNQWVYLIAVQPLLSIFHNIVVVVVIITVVVDFPLLLGAAVLWWDLLGPPLLLSIVHLSKKRSAS